MEVDAAQFDRSSSSVGFTPVGAVLLDEVRVRETDLTDPTCGLHARLVDVALTRRPFDETGLTVHELRADPVGALLRADDPLARRDSLKLADLADRPWFRFPEGTDPLLAVVLE